MPLPDVISIYRQETGEVIAEGPIDDLAAMLLQRASFLPVTSGRISRYRLPANMGKAWEDLNAEYAARMLDAARYVLEVDADLFYEHAYGHPYGVAPHQVSEALHQWPHRVRDAQVPFDLGVFLANMTFHQREILGPIADVMETAGLWLEDLDDPRANEEAARLHQLSDHLKTAEGAVNQVGQRLMNLPDLTPATPDMPRARPCERSAAPGSAPPGASPPHPYHRLPCPPPTGRPRSAANAGLK
ncbi:hypothetical protein [Streptomyces decoyicus]|uniref:hypothetical protein n=1 Tax=Streptomyces decoyicus TaxID=249567 RepID=UPI00386A68A4